MSFFLVSFCLFLSSSFHLSYVLWDPRHAYSQPKCRDCFFSYNEPTTLQKLNGRHFSKYQLFHVPLWSYLFINLVFIKCESRFTIVSRRKLRKANLAHSWYSTTRGCVRQEVYILWGWPWYEQSRTKHKVIHCPQISKQQSCAKKKGEFYFTQEFISELKQVEPHLPVLQAKNKQLLERL